MGRTQPPAQPVVERADLRETVESALKCLKWRKQMRQRLLSRA
jgi:hypothetical protein